MVHELDGKPSLIETNSEWLQRQGGAAVFNHRSLRGALRNPYPHTATFLNVALLAASVDVHERKRRPPAGFMRFHGYDVLIVFRAYF
jgi:hypothetical protein